MTLFAQIRDNMKHVTAASIETMYTSIEERQKSLSLDKCF